VKIKVEWKREIEGISEIEVDAGKVADWLNEPWNKAPGQPHVTPEMVTEKEAFDWLQSGDDDVWAEQIDTERDARDLPWNDLELERLHVERQRT
jgi:hypothetical protein